MRILTFHKTYCERICCTIWYHVCFFRSVRFNRNLNPDHIYISRYVHYAEWHRWLFIWNCALKNFCHVYIEKFCRVMTWFIFNWLRSLIFFRYSKVRHGNQIRMTPFKMTQYEVILCWILSHDMQQKEFLWENNHHWSEKCVNEVFRKENWKQNAITAI